LPVLDEALIGRLFREESGRSVATLIRIFGDIDLAEDAVQEAFTVALGFEHRSGSKSGRYTKPDGLKRSV
jgi:RNA polymerase sigma-70 factor (ECF subfamily)